MNKLIRSGQTLIAISCSGLACLLIFTLPVLSHRPMAQNQEADSWLAMNRERQFGFVLGYTIGVSRGFAEGCEAYDKIVTTGTVPLKDDPLGKCFATTGRGFSKPVEFYVSRISEFYKAYSTDRSITVGELLKKLSDSENMTPEQIHQWFKQQHQ